VPGFRYNPDKYRNKSGMTNSFFMQAIFISFLGHITLFSMFSLSFGPKIPEVNFSRVYFWGAIFRSPDLMNNRNFDIGYKTGRLTGKSEITVLNKINRENLLASRDYFPASRHSGIPPKAGEAGSRPIPNNNWREKPPVSLTFNQEKIAFTRETTPISLMSGRKESAIMFYPRLPYHFALYFKDRQTVHIELAFAVVSGAQRNSILVKRRISSGNLEADLLSMRYISRYLFMQQRGFVPNKWQTVKIDLSTAND